MIPRRIGLRWVVAALVLATVLPLGLAAALGVRRAWRRQIATVERQNVETVRAISVAMRSGGRNDHGGAGLPRRTACA